MTWTPALSQPPFRNPRREALPQTMPERPSRPELAEFLRSRRSRLAPTDFGLPAGTRRRTAGLRREEVATLAGIGLSWYTMLEQGKAIEVSTGFL